MESVWSEDSILYINFVFLSWDAHAIGFYSIGS